MGEDGMNFGRMTIKSFPLVAALFFAVVTLSACEEEIPPPPPPPQQQQTAPARQLPSGVTLQGFSRMEMSMVAEPSSIVDGKLVVKGQAMSKFSAFAALVPQKIKTCAVTGFINEGGLAIGLVKDNKLAGPTSNVDTKGPFMLIVTAPNADDYMLTLSHNLNMGSLYNNLVIEKWGCKAD